MKKSTKKEIIHLLFEITYAASVLILATVYWYLPRKKMQERPSLGYQVEGLGSFSITQDVFTKQVRVNNEDGKGEVMLIIQEDTKNNQPVYYQLVIEGKETEARVKREDGAIYLLDLVPHQKTEFEVRIWTNGDKINGSLELLPIFRENQV